jgi:hypothetical protein
LIETPAGKQGTEAHLEEFGKVMARGGSGVVISSQSGHRLPALTVEQNKALAMTPTDELLMDGGVTAAYWFGDVAEVCTP